MAIASAFGFENTIVNLIQGGGVSSIKSLTYPTDIEKQDNGNRFMRIIVMENENFCSSVVKNANETATTATSQAIDSFQSIISKNLSAPEKVKLTMPMNSTLCAFTLPLPNELSDSQRHNWSTSESLISEAFKKVGGKTGKLGELGYQAYSEASSNAGYRKLTLDPGYFQDYKGTQPRDISFSFTLMPNNHQEAINIQDIIYKLKQYTLPQTQINSVALRSPYYFELQFGNKIIDDMLCLKHVVCTGMSVNYGADGNMQFFANGMPKIITLSLSFIERQTMTSNMYSAELTGGR